MKKEYIINGMKDYVNHKLSEMSANNSIILFA